MASDARSQYVPFPYDRLTQSHGPILDRDYVDSRKVSQPDSQSVKIQTRDVFEIQPLHGFDSSGDVTDGGAYASSGLSSTEKKTDLLSWEYRSRWNRWTDLANEWWVYEILASILSLGCFSALVVVLRLSDDKEEQRWFGDRLSLNGLVALLTTFIRASMMVSVAAALAQLKWNWFHIPLIGNQKPPELRHLDLLDQASRGPYGSAKLIFSSAWLSLSALGALITISTLALDSFSQEIITISPKTVPSANGTTAEQLSRSDLYNNFTKEFQETNYLPDLTTTAAVYTGLFDYESITPPSAQCSTGNCTWPITPSLAVCGSCTNLTPTMTHTCITQSGLTSNCTYAVQDGDGYDFWVAYEGGSEENGLPAVGSLALMIAPFIGSHYNNTRIPYINNFIEIDVPVVPKSSPNVRSCALWFCIQAYNTSVENGILTQQIIGNYSQVDIDTSEYDGRYYNFTDIPEIFNTPTQEVFSVDPQVLIAFKQTPLLNASVWNAFDGFMRYAGNTDMARALVNVSDWNHWIDQFALGLSNNVRQTGALTMDKGHYAGTVMISMAYVHVRWLWLIFPATLVVSSIIFLCASITQTHQRKVRPWKTNALALLSCSTDEDIETACKMGQPLDKVRAYLEYVDDGGRFVKFRKD